MKRPVNSGKQPFSVFSIIRRTFLSANSANDNKASSGGGAKKKEICISGRLTYCMKHDYQKTSYYSIWYAWGFDNTGEVFTRREIYSDVT